jgi:hypothetical protein
MTVGSVHAAMREACRYRDKNRHLGNVSHRETCLDCPVLSMAWVAAWAGVRDIPVSDRGRIGNLLRQIHVV